ETQRQQHERRIPMKTKNDPLNNATANPTPGERRSRLRTLARLGLAALWLLALSTPQAIAAGLGSKRGVSAMTVNLYVGGGTGRVLALDPTDPGYVTNLIATVTGIYYEIVASQPQARLEGVADAIAARKPDLVSVEEASLIRNESPGDLVFGGTNL